MTFSPALPIATDANASRHGTAGVVTRILAAVRAACERQGMRRAYKHMLDCDEQILRDVGLTRADVRRALAAC